MKRKSIVFFGITFLILQIAKAQLPVNDASWHLHPGMSDEFNAANINTALWDTTYNFWTGSVLSNVANGAEWDFSSNLIMTGTTLKIKADTLSPNHVSTWGNFPDYGYGTTGQSLTYAYQGGVIKSKDAPLDTLYSFGYVEIRAKFPSKKYNPWPAFWLNSISDDNYYNEIDIAENNSLESFKGYQVGNNAWVNNSGDDPFCCGHNTFAIANVLPSTDSLKGAFHKFAVEWNSTGITYYFDDVPTTTVYDPTGVYIPQNPMRVFLNFCVWPWAAADGVPGHGHGPILPADWNGLLSGVLPHGNETNRLWPQYFEIDYFHYYTLGKDCSTNLTNLCTPGGYDRKVKKSIATDNTCTPTFNPSTAAGSYTLRATDYVLLDVGTVIDPSGTGYFVVETMGCP